MLRRDANKLRKLKGIDELEDIVWFNLKANR